MGREMRRVICIVTIGLIALLHLTLMSAGVCAGLRTRMTDQVAVRRAEAIVVGRIVEGSLRHVTTSARRGVECEALLAVTEVITATAAVGTSLPIVFHHGLAPFITGTAILVNDCVDDLVLEPRCERDCLWLLWHSGGLYEEEVAERLGVVDPVQIQLLQFKDYFSAYLSPDPGGEIARLCREGGKIPGKDMSEALRELRRSSITATGVPTNSALPK